ncbi:PRC and DUF2382 domain-containing protein [Dietzia massiliensis]|uniref:PRC and DUF2382 domain-containing protein n=1 Tax=Dietzia massiliensis TaxID=2697499 RepID=UPI001BD02D9D|nr:PRC and DUF2382 domain-containing protein [Dietzia massiliensis]MBS7549369.1 YsnF/AvaK domain-containing protein [Dietzia massiliensis]
MIGKDSLDRLTGATAYDHAGEKIGKIGTIYLDDDSDEPKFATVSTGLFGMSESFVPLQGARMEGDDLHVTYAKDQVKDAPRVDAGGHLSPDEENRLYEHYQLEDGGRRGGGTGTRTDLGNRDDRAPGTAGAAGAAGVAGTAGAAGAAGAAGTAGAAGADDRRRGDRDHEGTETVTAHEERLNVGTREEEAGRVRLRKYTTTENEAVEVPVSKEKLVVEREDVEGRVRKGGLDETADGDRDEEIVLREERPVVEKETVERERVNVGKEKVTDSETVSDQLRTEHIDVEGDVTEDRGGRGHRDGRSGTADGR